MGTVLFNQSFSRNGMAKSPNKAVQWTARAEPTWNVDAKLKINLFTDISGSPVCP
jgi:hypothetical protein